MVMNTSNCYESSDSEKLVQVAWLCIWAYYKARSDLLEAAQKNLSQNKQSYFIVKPSDTSKPWNITMKVTGDPKRAFTLSKIFYFSKGVKYTSDLGSNHLTEHWITLHRVVVEQPYIFMQFLWKIFSLFNIFRFFFFSFFFYLQLTELTSLIMVCKEKL